MDISRDCRGTSTAVYPILLIDNGPIIGPMAQITPIAPYRPHAPLQRNPDRKRQPQSPPSGQTPKSPPFDGTDDDAAHHIDEYALVIEGGAPHAWLL